MVRTAAALALLSCASVALAQLPDLPKNIPGTVTMQRLNDPPIATTKPTYPDSLREKWIQGTVTLDVVIGTNGEVEQVGCDDYCKLFPAAMAQAAADAVKQWKWKPISVKGKPARVRTRLAVPFTLDEHSAPISVCSILAEPRAFVGKNPNVFGIARREHGIKVLAANDCDGTMEIDDDNAITPPQKDAKYAALQQGVAAGSAEVTVRGLVRDENRPGAYPGYRLILERVLKVK